MNLKIDYFKSQNIKDTTSLLFLLDHRKLAFKFRLDLQVESVIGDFNF
jgi:hypothetical protein